MSVSAVTPIDVTFAVRLDQVDSTTTYVGEAPIGSLDTEPRWRVRKLLTSGSVLSILWADGNQQFDNVWDNRASLTYI